MRYEDLVFAPHARLGARPDGIGLMQRLRAAHPAVPPAPVDAPVEQAWIDFPNGWRLGILRGLLGLAPFSDFETTRFAPGGTRETACYQNSVAAVQREIDAVAALPAAPATGAMAARRDAECLARAVLLFHRGGPWTRLDGEVWLALTGDAEATTRSLCDLARRIGARHQASRRGTPPAPDAA